MTDKELERLQKGLRRAYQANDIKEASFFCNSIGVLCSQTGKHEEALRYHKEELQLCENLQDKLGTAVANRKIGESLASLCHFSDALKHQQKYLELAHSLGNVEEVQRAYTTIGRVWYMWMKSDDGDVGQGLEKARDAFIAGLRSCEELETLGTVSRRELCEMRGGLYLNLGLLADESGDSRTAEDHFERATRIGKEVNAHSLVWQSQLNLGEMLLQRNKPGRALVAYKESLHHAMASNNKQQKADSLLQIAMLHANQVNFLLAKQHLRAVLKLDCWSEREEEEAMVLKYKAVCKILRLEMEAEHSVGAQARMEVYEQLGDLCAHRKIGFYHAAVQFYLKELNLAMDHGVEPKELSKIFFSVAETLSDNGQYDEALSYYDKELSMWSEHPAESASTWTNIARVHEAAGHSTTVVMEAYKNASQLAETAHDPHLLADIYNSILEYLQERPEMESERERVEGELEALLQSHSEVLRPVKCSEDETPPLNSQDLTEELLLSPISSEEEEEDVVGLLEPSGLQLRGMALRKRSKVIKRNEKGETPLHVAVINGNLPRVRQLVKELHVTDMNARDHCGWTPLHEACNHGYAAIVECLMDAGADINDQGGAHCNGITPLMDAVCNGHVEVVTLLVDKGADLALKDVKGMTSLDLVEQILASHSRSDSSYELFQEHTTIRDLLRQEMMRKGLFMRQPETNSLPDRPSPPLQPVVSRESLPALVCSSSEEDSPHQRPVAVISPMRRRTAFTEEDPIPALLPDHCCNDEDNSQQEHPVVDDWLVDDMGAPPFKKRRFSEDLMPTQRVRALQSTRNVMQAIGHGVGQEKGRQQRSGIVRQRCPNRKSVIEIASDSEDMTAEGEGEHGSNNVSTHADYWLGDVNDFPTLQMNDPFPLSTQQIPLSTQYSYSEQPIRVRVLIEGVHYLIPCPRQLEDATSTTVEWLAGKVTERYFIQHGRRPVLQLATSEGALLCSSDAVTDVVKEGEEVRVVVERWENPPLSECYLSACSRMTCVCHKQVLQLFQGSSNPASLDFSNFGLQAKHSSALFHSLLSLSNLTSLSLSGNRLLDSTMKHLATTLLHLTSLVSLDLSCTGLTNLGLNMLSHPSSASSSHPSLRKLVLSHNHLGQTAGFSLSSLLSKFPNVSCLYLEDCGLSSYVLQPHTGFGQALKGLTGLAELSFSHNIIGGEGHQLVVSALAGSKLTLLDLSSSCSSFSSASSSSSSTNIMDPVSQGSDWTQLGAKLPQLCHLNLSHCDLRDTRLSLLAPALPLLKHLKELNLAGNTFGCDGVKSLTRYLKECTSLQLLDVSGNPALGNNGCLAILLCCLLPSSIKDLKMAACGVRSPLPTELWDAQCSLECMDLSDNDITGDDRHRIVQWWGRQHTAKHQCVMHGSILTLYVHGV